MAIFDSKLPIADMALTHRAVEATPPLTATAVTVRLETLAAVGTGEVALIDQPEISDSRSRVVSVGPIPIFQEGVLIWGLLSFIRMLY